MASAALREIFWHFKGVNESLQGFENYGTKNALHLQKNPQQSLENSHSQINLNPAKLTNNSLNQTSLKNSKNILNSQEKLQQSPQKQVEFTLYGSFVACELFKGLKEFETLKEKFKDSKEFKNYDNFSFKFIVQAPKAKGFLAPFKRLLNLKKLAKDLGKFNYALSFRSASSSKILLFFISAKNKFVFDKNQNKEAHQVLKYLAFVENVLNLKATSSELFLPSPAFKDISANEKQELCDKFTLLQDKKWLGINAGAKYGLAKCWDKEYFAKVALEFKKTHEILIFGVQSEAEICEFIEQNLAQKGVRAHNLCGKTSISELCTLISALDIFISNDSGAMHIAASYKTPTVAIFGPTRFTQTSPWQNERAKIVHLNLACMPCMKRVCPLKHHGCMKDLKPILVINAANELLAL
ncbi:lipopolysaccharide heptosyltransferase II [Campylobacter troglodytis]|nr:lipopolysaccharide heptosyltransferase II [Campylobacter troglodytis]